MKANLEKQPFQVRGVELVSESDTEKLMLESLWSNYGGPAEFARNPDGSVTLVMVPSPEGRATKKYIVQVQVTAGMEERAASLIDHCIEAGVVVGNFIPGETARVLNTFEQETLRKR